MKPSVSAAAAGHRYSCRLRRHQRRPTAGEIAGDRVGVPGSGVAWAQPGQACHQRKFTNLTLVSCAHLGHPETVRAAELATRPKPRRSPPSSPGPGHRRLRPPPETLASQDKRGHALLNLWAARLATDSVVGVLVHALDRELPHPGHCHLPICV
jgi:hypothetical protein